MNNKKVRTYLLSGLIPLLIFVVCSFIESYVPFGTQQLNIYDSFTQYPGFIMGLKRALIEGNLFYSWGASLGFNFFSSLSYYGMSPLNLLGLLSSPINYTKFIAIMTYIRIFLLGFTMCFYLEKKGLKQVEIILFSTLFALMGFTSTYYYNYMWIDGIIMLPIVIYGLDKLIDKNSPSIYIFSLFLTIFINFYIGYMLIIFCLLYYIYKLIINRKTSSLKTFIISTILAVGLSLFILMPTTYALLNGKASLFSSVDYSGISENAYTFFLKLLAGTYEANDHMQGSALIYSGIISIVLVIFLFFNKKTSKREKIATALVLIIYYLSFSINALNYVWHMFQEPIWWPSRFSFTFSFFIILLASRSLVLKDSVKMNFKEKLIIILTFIICVIVGLCFKSHTFPRNDYTYIFVTFSILTFIEMIFLLNKKYFIPFLIGISFLEIAINTYNSLRQNITDNKEFYGLTLKNDLSKVIPDLNLKEENKFFRMELTSAYTSNDGLYFGYNGINYFNSMRNNKTLNTLKKLGVKLEEGCSLVLDKFDPVFLSLFNIKYIYGNMEYFKKNNKIFENPYPLSIGYTISDNIKKVKLNDDSHNNLNNIVSSMLNRDVLLYKRIKQEAFKNELDVYSYSFISDKHYLLMPIDSYTKVYINGELKSNTTEHEVNIKDKVVVIYKTYNKQIDIHLDMLDLEVYENSMKELEENILNAYANKNGHILEGTIDIKKDSYLFMSIPYEKGLKVFVDGKEINYDVVLESFIGFKIEKGIHQIFVNYTPKLFNQGSCLSGIFLAATLFYLLKLKKAI